MIHVAMLSFAQAFASLGTLAPNETCVVTRRQNLLSDESKRFILSSSAFRDHRMWSHSHFIGALKPWAPFPAPSAAGAGIKQKDTTAG